jgi:hypothetical protein
MQTDFSLLSSHSTSIPHWWKGLVLSTFRRDPTKGNSEAVELHIIFLSRHIRDQVNGDTDSQDKYLCTHCWFSNVPSVSFSLTLNVKIGTNHPRSFKKYPCCDDCIYTLKGVYIVLAFPPIVFFFRIPTSEHLQQGCAPRLATSHLSRRLGKSSCALENTDHTPCAVCNF